MSFGKVTTETIASAQEVTDRVSRLRLVGGDRSATTNSTTGDTKVNTEEKAPYKYAHYLPVWEKSEFPRWEQVPYVDPGSRATVDKRNLFQDGATHRHITPALGEEIHGVQLSELSEEGLDDLALLAAERGLLIFRDQNFKDIGPEKQLEIVRHFGRLHIHPTMGHPEGYPEMHVVYRDPTDSTIARYTTPGSVQKVSSVSWHADHTSEIQPPGITFFFALETPPSGGDTLFASTTQLYENLSPAFRERLEGLEVVHDNSNMINHSRSSGGPVRFEPVINRHPLVRTHPVTGKKFIHCTGGFATRIYGYKQEESEYLMKFIMDLIKGSGDIQARANYLPGTVAVWDNRVVAHTALYDFKGDEKRHVVRIAGMAERPV